MSNHYLQEYINIELKIGDKFCNFIYLNRSPSQTQDEFKNISENFENNLNDLLQNNPFLVEIIGYFNVKSKHWYCHDKSCLEGDAVDNIAKQYVLHQIIREPTHILDSSSSCTDLVFYFLAQLKTESGILPSLRPNCHHQIIYAKFNWQIYFPSPYLREVWH